ncbi:uncharacterized protein LOC104896915 [Beta vulgaris subsp. vulgaris]|uniref:uncharacterized protein LOC104896915 n=1 Tax=Beta vulgaris subsp. vulgaris TaxID=3555 RepID=UPI002037197A|nr:uncharacterized protein LOC104896915 [Beta vulgaris subsp. vulgaris]
MARSMELKGRLTRIKKTPSQSMDGYLRDIKVIVDSLAAIECPVSNQDLVQYTLFNLDRDSKYDHIDGSDSSSHHALVVVQSSGTGTGSPSKSNSGGQNRGRNNKNCGGNNNRNQNNLGNGGGNGGYNNSRGSGNNNNNANRGRP